MEEKKPENPSQVTPLATLTDDADEKFIRSGIWLDPAHGPEGKVLVRPHKKVKDLSWADVEAAKRRLEAPRDKKLERPLEDKPQRFWPKKSLIKGKKTKLATFGLSQEILDKGDPRYAECVKIADDYRKHRSRELVIMHGHISSGASSLLSSASLALAASRYLYERFAETGEISVLQMASKLATDARQTELAVWELCAREAISRKKAAAQQQAVPWLTQGQTGIEIKRGRGRPRKDSYNAGTNRITENSYPEVIDVTGEATDSANGDSDAGEPSSSGD